MDAHMKLEWVDGKPAVSAHRRLCRESADGSSDGRRKGVGSVARADVRSASGRSSGEDVDDRCRLDAAAYLICTRFEFELSSCYERNPR